MSWASFLWQRHSPYINCERRKSYIAAVGTQLNIWTYEWRGLGQESNRLPLLLWADKIRVMLFRYLHISTFVVRILSAKSIIHSGSLWHLPYSTRTWDNGWGQYVPSMTGWSLCFYGVSQAGLAILIRRFF